MRYLTLILLALVLSACATEPRERRVEIRPQWIRSTLIHENYGFRHPERTAPLIDSEILYQGNGFDGFVAMDKKTGRVIWRKPVTNGVESGSAISNEMIYFGGSDGQFYGLDRITGKTVWTFPTRSEILSAPLVSQDAVFFLSGNNILYALDRKTGKQLWFYNRGEASSLSIRGGARPTMYNGILYEGFSDGYLAAINSRDGSLLWERKLNGNLKFVDVDATSVVDEAHIWVSSYDGSLYCLSRTDGQIVWRLDDGGFTPVTIDGETLYYTSVNQNVYALDKKTGQQKWKHNYEEKYGVPTQAQLYKGLLLFGTSSGNLVALSATTGKMVASYTPGAGIFATPLVEPDGWVYVFSNQANLHAVKVSWRTPEEDLEWKK